MKTITFLFSFFTIAVAAQQLTPAHPVWKKIEAENGSIGKAMLSEDVKALDGIYMEKALIMPEHSIQRQTRDAISEFYTQWFAQVTVNGFQKSVYEMTAIGDYTLEIGMFTQDFAKNDGSSYDYNGKYMVLWHTGKDGARIPKIATELWGANAPFDDNILPQIDDSRIRISTTGPLVEKKLIEEVEGRNALIGRLVTERKGAEHATLFMDDAIYMTYYTPMLIGKKQITDYFTEHEKPGEVTIDKLSLKTSWAFEPVPGTVIEYGYYSVDFTSGDYKGNVQGKSINVWKRNDDGTLMLFRQAVNHD